jgi:uncharacterized protein YacL
MVLTILRALFVLLMAAAGWMFLVQLQGAAGAADRATPLPVPTYAWLAMAASLCVGVLVICIDILSARTKLTVFSGTFLGLVVGLVIAYALSFVIQLIVDQFVTISDSKARATLLSFLDTAMGMTACYLSISFILQTKDDFRFIIPYVEFSRQTKGGRPMLLDTSVLIDGRISDIAVTGIIESQLIVPRFVQNELQHIADSSDKLIRNRGRRGLDILTKLQAAGKPEIIDYDSSGRDDRDADVDQKLMDLAKTLEARVLTNDYNLNKLAQLRGVDVINIHDLATALKPNVLPGEKMVVRLMKPGEDPGQGIGYLDDGTMVVVEQGRTHLNEEVEFTVTNVVQKPMGKMIFGRIGNDSNAPSRRSRPRSDAPSSAT